MLYDKIDSDISKLKIQLAELEAEKASLSKLTASEQLAIYLHKAFCHDNHVDGCGWEYEIKAVHKHDWSQHAHSRWHVKAKACMGIV